MTIGAPPPTAPADPASPTARADVAARQLEAFFLRQLLAAARPAGGGALTGGGVAGDTFKQMFDEAIADQVATAGGVGVAPLLAHRLAATPGTADPIAPIAGALGGSRAPGAPGAATPAAGAAAIGPDLGDGAPRLRLPVAGRPSSGYGPRVDPLHGTSTTHPGFDLAAPAGTVVAAAAAGTVVHAGPAGTYGNLVTVRHPDGFETRYAHLQEVDVAVGDRLEAGTPLGKVGSTGYSTGPHLHFELRKDGQAVDPAPRLPLHSSVARTTR